MPTRRIHVLVVVLCLLSLAVRVNAQARGYHIELSDGTTGWVTLVNDSNRSIEAYHLKAMCAHGGGSQWVHDALETPDAHALRGQAPHPPIPEVDVLEPGQRMRTRERVNPQPPGCEQHTEVDAVIYSDGSYEGSEDAARGLQAWRDGIAAALQYWHVKLSSNSTANADPQAVKTEAANRAQEAMHAFVPCGAYKPECQYWLGREHVDANLSLQGGNQVDNNLSAEELSKRQVDFISRWQKKLDTDMAFKKLDIAFPLPPEFANIKP